MARETAERGVVSLSRRRLLATAGGLAAGSVAYLTVGTRGVRAQVSPDGLSVADGSYEAPDGEVYSPRLSVDVAYQYAGTEGAAQVMVALLVDGSLLDDAIVPAGAPDGSGTETLAGALVASRAWDTSDWQPPTDGEVAHTVTVEVRMEVRDSAGATLAKANASDTATITITDGGPSVTATVGGSGSVSFLPSEDSTPTG